MSAKKILIVDDDATVHLIVTKILAENGYNVVSAKNGEQGFQLALSERPQMIILDVIMPGIKGRDLCAKFKTYDVLKSIPVVFLTAKNSQDDVQAELEAGAVSHLTKPIDAAAVLATVRSIIG